MISQHFLSPSRPPSTGAVAVEKKDVVVKSSAPKKISQIQFGTLQQEDIQKAAEFQVTSRLLFEMPARAAAPFGCMDARLGISDKASLCKTCQKKLADCSGHFGYIQLELPVFHAGYFKHTLVILQCVCKQCSRILLPANDRKTYLKKMQNPSIDALVRAALFKRVVDLCKRNPRCQHCGFANGVVKKVGSGFFKIVHERNHPNRSGRLNAGATAASCDTGAAADMDVKTEQHFNDLNEIVKTYPDLKPHIQKSVELLNPMRAYEVLTHVSEADIALLWMDRSYGRPDSLIMWTVPVPPVPIRPSVPQEFGGGSTEDDITMKLQEIIEMNNALKLALEGGATMKMVAEDWEFLQIQVALFINGETPGIPRQLLGTKTVRGLCQRLKGKQGRFRGNLSGKRVDFSGRTVISPDPNLEIDQVGVPVLVAKTMTYPERVNRYNIEKLRKMVLNGPDVHPGANMIRGGDSFAITLQFADRAKAAKTLRIGDVVERHLHDGDIVLFNRQPSLHKLSIMAHRVKVYPWRTFRFNECCCTPYNADFDGDEMNMHVPQTEEARAEAAELMIVTNNLVTPRNGEPLIAATQDFITGAYFMTQKDVFYTKSQFCALVAYLSDAQEKIDMPMPAVLKPRLLWTGKQVMSLLVCPTRSSKSRVHVECEEKFYTSDKHFCPQDGFVAFRRGELISGNMGKKALGGDSKSGLFYVLIRDFGPAEATRCMARLSKLTARYLGDRGFSIGIDDVTPSAKMLSLKTRILTEGQHQAEDQIQAYHSGQIRLKPGCDALQSLESEVNGILGKIREICGKEALVALNPRNAALCMSQCGSKGSPLNISQMVACLGQQSVGGARIQNGFVSRTLPHFPLGDLSPASRGFVANSFYSGLTATEFFFHTMGGREGLVDTAVKTAETGYMARRLMKALEDLSMQYDMTVRNSEQTVVQFAYGDDGLNPNVMEKGDRPVDYRRLMVNVCSGGSSVTRAWSGEEAEGRINRDGHESLGSRELRDLIRFEISKERFTRLLPQGQQFLDETLAFFSNIAVEIEKLEEVERCGSIGLSETMAAPMSHEQYEAILLDSRNNVSISALRSRLSMQSAKEKSQWRENSRRPFSPEYHEMYRLLRDNVLAFSVDDIRTLLEQALTKYYNSMIVPGEAVGAVGAQSLSEPGTQMTLKTFHFAGVASMNVTLGVPRLKEIINASKVISTPIMEARLVQDDSSTSARIVKAQIEKTLLGQVAKYIKEVHDRDQSYISIKLDMDVINNLHLKIDAFSVRWAILHAASPGQTSRAPVLRLLREKHVMVVSSSGTKLRILPPSAKDTQKGVPAHKRIYFIIQALKTALPNIIVCGIPTVQRAVINEELDAATNKKRYYLLVEGYGLSDVMGCAGVDGANTHTNNILETQAVLGIEAARSVIAAEIKFIMTAYGITVDRRHLILLSDVMTFKGEVLGITRFGVAKMRESVLMLASFEKTTDHLFDAAVHSRQDSIVGVSECIIMGVPVPIGTGLFKVLQKAPKVRVQRRTRLLETI